MGRSRASEIPGRLTDQLLSVCGQCDRVWEYSYDYTSTKKMLFFYSDFPRWGKKIQDCPECEKH